MISFHPTLPYSTYRQAMKNEDDLKKAGELVGNFFPECTTTLTDSGRSAIALAIETLELQGSRLLLPAYVCNVLLPVFEQYNITPVFLDIDLNTFKPPRDAYTTSLLETVDAVLLVATYGIPIPKEIIELLKKQGKITIEDFAHCPLPNTPEEITGDARCYSLAKTLPVMDGGVAVFRGKRKIDTPMSQDNNPLLSLKNWLKLFPATNALLTNVKRYINHGATRSGVSPVLRFRGIHQPSPTTIKILISLLTRKNPEEHKSQNRTYCHPFLTSRASLAESILKKRGVAAERVWHDPIVMHPKAHTLWGINPQDYPNTLEVAKHIICAPLWHIPNDKEESEYLEHLKKILAGKFADLREKP